MFYTGDAPPEVRIHQLNPGKKDSVIFNIYFGPRQRMDVYVGEDYVLPINAKFSESDQNNLLYVQPPRNNPNYFIEQFRRSFPSNGVHVYDLTTRTLSLKIRYSEPIVIRQTEVSMLSIEVGVEMSDDFFAEDLILKLAAQFNIPLANIRIVQAVNENDVRKRRDGAELLTVDLEFGDSPSKKVSLDNLPVSTGRDNDDSNSEKGK